MKSKVFLWRFYLLLMFTCLTISTCLAVNTVDWKGTTSNSWTTGSNWSGNSVPLITDDIRIGVVSFTNQPIITANTTMGNLIFGSLTGTGGNITLTINSGTTITVNGNVTQMHSSSNTSVTTNINGGNITCTGSFLMGDNTAPPAPTGLAYIAGAVNITNLTTVNINLQNFSIAQNLLENTTSTTATIPLTTVVSSNVNNPTLNFNNGTISVGGNFQMTNSAYVSTPGFNTLGGTVSTATNKSQFFVNPSTNATAGTASTFSVAGSITINADGHSAATLDLYGTGSGSSTVNYTGTSAQTVYTSMTGLDATPATYQNLGFSGAGTKTIQSGTITMTGNWNSTGGKVNAVTNNTTVTFQGTTQTLTDAASDGGNGVVFQNAIFQGGNTKTMSSGNFSIAAAGVLSMTASSTLNANGNLTLISDSTSSASVASIPVGSAITGSVNVQRFIKGSVTDLSKRGYRLITSAVYTGTASSIKVFDLKYLLNNCYISGAAGGGFNTTGTNPSLYIYREDIAPGNNGFTAGNFKGIAKINNANAYDIGTQKYLTTANIADTTVNIPAGNGILFFFRGNLTDNSSQTGSKTVQPFDYPESTVFTQKGTLNTGGINVRLWFRQDNLLSYTNTTLQNASIRGFCLVGNPYASTINWEKFNRNSANSSIYGGNFPAASTSPSTIWVYNPTNKQYETYMQKSGTIVSADTTTNVNPGIAVGSASNMIASGQGFFIRATAANQSLTFTEVAKTNTQPTASNLIKLLAVNMPGNTVAAMATVTTPNPLLRLQLFQDTINTDEIVVALNANASTKFVEHEDAEDIGGNGAAVSLSALTSDSVLVAIDQVPMPQKVADIINLAVNSTTTGTFSLKLTQQSNVPSSTVVWLKDNYKKDSVDIIHNPNYSFNIDKIIPATFANGRFQLCISGDSGTSMQLLTFNAAQVNNTKQVKTTWTAVNESTSTAFSLERSNDNAVTFNPVGSVQSTGAGNYSFTDPNAKSGQNIYRLKITDVNNSVTYSANVQVTITDNSTIASSINIYPNPAVSTINLKMNPVNSVGAVYNILLLNSTGSLVKTITSTQPYWQENVSNLMPGLYVMKVINNKDQTLVGTGKFLKM